MQRNIDPIIEVMLRAVEEHRDGPGAYARWRIQDAKGSRNMKPSEYGVADAANILRFASDGFGRMAHFAEIDWVFLTNRSSMQTGYRRQEALARIRDFAEGYLDWMESDLETTYRERYDDLHMLFGAVCCLSELQLALPGEIRTTIPMKNVLDRRPFI